MTAAVEEARTPGPIGWPIHPGGSSFCRLFESVSSDWGTFRKFLIPFAVLHSIQLILSVDGSCKAVLSVLAIHKAQCTNATYLLYPRSKLLSLYVFNIWEIYSINLVRTHGHCTMIAPRSLFRNMAFNNDFNLTQYINFHSKCTFIIVEFMTLFVSESVSSSTVDPRSAVNSSEE